ncbi:MAG TPA: ABC transporter substrate-binding protein [Azospirillaceae bacterium]|nr:ABC transporter substrate-binding protein [Azospirillaceae bacterium]
MAARRLPRLRTLVRRTAGPALALLLSAGAAQAAPPQRVVSLNLCTDQLAVLLLPPERIAALSFLSRDEDLSYVADRARSLPVVQGQAEEILPLAPDLVLAGTFTTRPTVALLKARGIPVLELDMPHDFAAIRAQLRQVAAALGEEARGEALVAAMDRTLALSAPADGRRPSALSFAPGGFTSGAGTLSAAVMEAAGLSNYAGGRGLAGYGYLPVEEVAAAPPDLLVADTEPEAHPSLAGRLLSHPALARAVPAEARTRIRSGLWTCGGPFTAEAVAQLAAMRTRLLAGPQVAASTDAAHAPAER